VGFFPGSAKACAIFDATVAVSVPDVRRHGHGDPLLGERHERRDLEVQAETVTVSRPEASRCDTPHLYPLSGEPDGYDFEGPTRFDRLFTGNAVERPKSPDLNDRSGKEGTTPRYV